MAYRRDPPGRALTAAAEPLSERLAIRTSAQVGEGWQVEAWQMFDAVPELRTAARITGQAMSQVRLTICRLGDDGNPAPVEKTHPAARALASFAGGEGGQSALLDALGVMLTVTGESIIVGSLDPTDAYTDHFAQWAAYSPQQVVVRNKAITVKLDESAMRAERKVDEENTQMRAIRIWRPHPRRSWEADSAARAAMTALKEIVLYDQHIEATAVSRLISAGLLGIPEGMSLPGAEAKDGDPTDPFMLFLLQVMSTAIGDRSSAAARVPVLVRGEAEDIAAMKLLSFATPFDAQVLELRTAALNRLGTAVDMPGELLTGYGALQHWTGALVTEDWVNSYLPALMGFVCGSLTTGWLYKALPEGTPADVFVWYDASQVRVRENVGPEAFQAYDRGEIGGRALRKAIGYDEGDAPNSDELRKTLLIEAAKKNPLLAPLALAGLGLTFTDAELATATQIAEVLPAVVAAEVRANTPIVPPVEPGTQPEPAPSTEPLRAVTTSR